MHPLLTVALLGLSAEGLALCPFFAFSLALSDQQASLRFLTGRIIGLVCFGIVVSIIGQSLPIQERFVNIVFGMSIMALGIFRIVKSTRIAYFQIHANTQGRPGPGHSCGKQGQMMKTFGFGLGLFRGLLNPGRKYVYLAPLLISAGLFKGLALSFTYGITSSFYLVLGFVSAGVPGKLTPHKQLIGTIGAMVLIVLGLVYSWRGFSAFSDGPILF